MHVSLVSWVIPPEHRDNPSRFTQPSPALMDELEDILKVRRVGERETEGGRREKGGRKGKGGEDD